MADVSFQDLCIDAADAPALAIFWGTVLGRAVSDPGDGGRRVEPSTSHGTDGLWVDPVPEPRSIKSRVHLDLRLPAPDPGPLVAAGAVVVREPAGDQHWWVLADPEGNEFCAMPPAPPEWGLPAVVVPTPFELVVDSADPQAQAAWWAERTGGNAATRDGAPFWWVEGAAGFPWAYWVFIAVPEPKSVKNRVHWDVRLAGEDPTPLIAAGARVLREPHDDITWWVLADPERNEFCAFPRSAAG